MLKENRLNSENNETKKEKTSNHKLLKFCTLILLLFSFFTIPTITLSNVKAEESDPLQGTWRFTLDNTYHPYTYTGLLLDTYNLSYGVKYIRDLSQPDTFYISTDTYSQFIIDDDFYMLGNDISLVNSNNDVINLNNYRDLIIGFHINADGSRPFISGVISAMYGINYVDLDIYSLLEDVENGDTLLALLQANATKQEEEEPLPDIPTIPESWRPINSGDLLRTFGTNLETALKLDFEITPTASSTSTLTFENGNVLFSSYNSNNELISYEFNRFMIESSSGGIFIYAQNEDTTISEQWYNANTGWSTIFYGYALIVDENTTISLNGNMEAFKWLYVKDKASSPTYSVSLLQGEWSDTQEISITNGLEYSINNGMTWFLINELPLNLSGVSQIKFRNNTQLQSTFYISLSALGSPLYSLTQGQETTNITIEEDITYYLGYIFAPSENMYFISGGYRFYNSFVVSNSYNYSLKYTFTFGEDTTLWTNIEVKVYSSGGWLDYTNNSGLTTYSVFSSDRLTNKTMRFNTNYPIQYRYITFIDQYVDKSTFDFLKASGEFGVFSYPEDSIDGEFDFGHGLLQGVNSFMSFEIFPGFSLLNLLQLTIAIPLLIYILKLFLGG